MLVIFAVLSHPHQHQPATVRSDTCAFSFSKGKRRETKENPPPPERSDRPAAMGIGHQSAKTNDGAGTFRPLLQRTFCFVCCSSCSWGPSMTAIVNLGAGVITELRVAAAAGLLLLHHSFYLVWPSKRNQFSEPLTDL